MSFADYPFIVKDGLKSARQVREFAQGRGLRTEPHKSLRQLVLSGMVEMGAGFRAGGLGTKFQKLRGSMILFAGDCHGDFVPVIEEASRASAVVLLGDQEPPNDLATELGPSLAPKTWWIYGNHDSDYLDFFENHNPMADRNLHCRVIEIEGVRIAGLGGVFRAKRFEIDQTTRLAEVDLDYPHDYREAWIKLHRGGRAYHADFTSIFPDDLKSLLTLAGHVDVLVTHEAPETHPLGFQLIGDLARAMGVKRLIHGHHHERYSATLDGEIRVEGIGMARTAEGFFQLCQGLGDRP